MTNEEKKRIEEYINTYRIYPDEYTGKRDPNILAKMNNLYRYDTKTKMIISLDGHINDNGDFVLSKTVTFPPGKPEEKVELKDDFERSFALHSKYILTKYNDMMKYLNHERGVIGNGQNEAWNLRDMVSEVEYLRSTYYDNDHENSKLRDTDKKEFDKQTARLRYFLRTYRDHIGDLVVTTTHNSKYDN